MFHAERMDEFQLARFDRLGQLRDWIHTSAFGGAGSPIPDDLPRTFRNF